MVHISGAGQYAEDRRYSGKMKEKRTKKELISELTALQQLVTESKKSETEFKLIEELLYRSEREKNSVLNAMFEYVLLVSKDLRIIWINDTVRRQFNDQYDELIGQYCYKIFANLNKPCRSCSARRAIETRSPITEDDVRFPSFPMKRWLIRHYPVDDNECIAVYTDVTESKQSAEALLEEQKQKDTILTNLKESEEKYRNLFENSRDAILVISEEGAILDVNRACINLLGITMEDCNQSNIWNNFLNHKEKERFISNIMMGEDVIDQYVRLRRKNGTEIDCLFSLSHNHTTGGNICGYQGIIRDITEQRKLEKELLEISDRERWDIGQELHDGLGQLLTGIALKSQSLVQSLKKKSISEAKDAETITNLINKAINQTRSVVKGLIPVSLQAGGILTTLKEIAENVNISYGILCTVNFNSTSVECGSVTANQLYLIAQEAILNVVKHSKAKQILISLNKEDDKIVLSIEDDGIGFSLAKKESCGRGFQIMQYRANMIDATLHIKENTKGGITITCVVANRQDQLFNVSP